MKRINVSLDTLDADACRRISRGGDLDTVLAGIHAARAHSLDVKINMVALKQQNEDALLPMAHFCAEHKLDLTLIETMPLGAGVLEREESYISLDDFTVPLRELYDLHPLAHKSAGPARYWRTKDGRGQIGVITPISQHFCETCNRVRMAVDGTIYLCLGQEEKVELRPLLRGGISDADLEQTLREAIELKPEKHEFREAPTKIIRFMSQTGG